MPALVSVCWGLVLGFGCGGSLGRLKGVELRYPYLLLAAFWCRGLLVADSRCQEQHPGV